MNITSSIYWKLSAPIRWAVALPFGTYALFTGLTSLITGVLLIFILSGLIFAPLVALTPLLTIPLSEVYSELFYSLFVFSLFTIFGTITSILSLFIAIFFIDGETTIVDCPKYLINSLKRKIK